MTDTNPGPTNIGLAATLSLMALETLILELSIPPHTPEYQDDFLTATDEVIAYRWEKALLTLSEPLREALWSIVAAHKDQIADHFYDVLLSDAEAHKFLSHDLVRARLRAQMANWISQIFSVSHFDEILRVVGHQRHIGQIHARMNIPFRVVMDAFRILKDDITIQIAEAESIPAGTKLSVLHVALSLIDESAALINDTYVRQLITTARTDQSYRLFALGQRIEIEYHQVKTALLEWLRTTLTALFDPSIRAHEQLRLLSTSAFGLWLAHKAKLVFSGSLEVQTIEDIVEDVDSVLTTIIESEDEPHSIRILGSIKSLDQNVSNILEILDSMLEHRESKTGFLDEVTLLLDSRFLGPILQHEIKVSERLERTFSLIIIEVDRFKELCDTYSVAAGNAVLQQLAGMVSSRLGPSDYAFRYNSREVLILLSDSNPEKAERFTESFRSVVAQTAFKYSDFSAITATVSVGATIFDGHPDYQSFITAAESALREALASGGNRAIMAGLRT